MSRAVTRAHGRAQQQEQRQAAAIAGFAAEFHGAEHYQQQQQPEAGGTQDDESSTTPSTAGHHDSSSPAAVANNNNNNNINNGTAAPPAAAAAAAANNRTNRVPSNRLLRIRQSFNATGVRKKARSESTFDGHQRNNIRLLLYLYENKPELLVEELRRQLEDANAVPDYSEVERRYPEYARRGGKKNLDERKEEFRQKLLLDDRWQGLFHSRPLLMLSKMVR